MPYLGDYNEDNTKLGFEFTTRDNSNVPTVLSGTPVITVVKISDGTTKTSAESYITLTAGTKNRVKIDLNGDAFFATGEDYSVYISTGTVDGGTVINEVVATFSIENRFSAKILEAKIDTVDTVADGIQTDLSNATDGLGALKALIDTIDTIVDSVERATILISTTIATLASQKSFTLTAGSSDNNAYKGHIIVITDASTAVQRAVGKVSAYTGSSKTITLAFDPGIFTMATTDKIDILSIKAVQAVWSRS